MADTRQADSAAGDEPAPVRVAPADLRAFASRLLVRKGMFAAEADIAAARMVEADLRGVFSHGTRMLPRYLKAMDLGEIDPRAQILTVTETPAMAVLDGSAGLGHVAATRGMQLAIEKARAVGTGTVAVRNSQHLGAAAVYVLLAVEEGMIGHCTTSTARASVAAYGSTAPATANNALAWGVPTPAGPPLVLDMACAGIAWGAVESRQITGEPLPPGLALDAAGNPTTDPALAVTLLPAAGPRGYGLALVCSILAGPLCGGRMPLHKTRSPFVEGSEHFFYAIDIARFGDPEHFRGELGRALEAIRQLTPMEGFDVVRLPGELESGCAERWSSEGIPLHPEHVHRLAELATAMKTPAPWQPPA